MAEAGHELETRALHDLDQLVRFVEIDRQRLLDQHVLAGLDRRLADLEVQVVGRGDEDEVDVLPLEQLAIVPGRDLGAEALRHRLRALQARDPDQLRPRVLERRRRVPLAHDARADEPDADDAATRHVP